MTSSKFALIGHTAHNLQRFSHPHNDILKARGAAIANLAPDTLTTFGEMLKMLRRRARLTQRELGTAVGYSETHITRLESNSRNPDVGTVRALFIEALDLAHEPKLAQRLIELAEAAHSKPHDEPVAPARLSNLPAQLTRFIGRMRELAEVTRKVSAHRLVTLTGPGGVGKTRLALEVGTAALDQFADGVWMIGLAPVADAARVPQTVASLFKLPDSQDRTSAQKLGTHLADKRLLLILDNCEHVIEACAELAETLLHACPQLHILATSREDLRVAGEIVWQVPALSDEESRQLFADRASAARLGFDLAAENTATVASICRRLDGIPLAIELAASRLNGLSVEQLAARLGDRFRFLTSGSRTALPRHQTLRALIDWSHDLLSDQERVLLRRLAVFSGGWTVEAAEQVCATPRELERELAMLFAPNVVPLLLNLVSKSLVVMNEREGEPRYHLLETIREYAWEQLSIYGETDAFRRQHLRCLLALLKAHAPAQMRESDTPLQFTLVTVPRAWIKRIETEHDNLQVALTWSLDATAKERSAEDRDTGMQLVLWLYCFWSLRGPRKEALEWFERALSHTDPTVYTQTRTRLLSAIASSSSILGDNARAEWASHEAITACRALGDPFDLMIALQKSTSVFLGRGDFAQAHVLCTEWLAIARALRHARYEGVALFHLGLIALQQNKLLQAAALIDESLQVLPLDDEGTRVTAQYHQSLILLSQGDEARALAQFQHTLAYFRETGFRAGVATVLHGIGNIALFQGDVKAAKQHYREGLDIFHRDGARQRAVWFVAALAAVAAIEHRPVQASTLWAAAEQTRQSVGYMDMGFEHDDYRAQVNAVRELLDEQTLANAEVAGRMMNFDQIVAFAMTD